MPRHSSAIMSSRRRRIFQASCFLARLCSLPPSCLKGPAFGARALETAHASISLTSARPRCSTLPSSVRSPSFETHTSLAKLTTVLPFKEAEFEPTSDGRIDCSDACFAMPASFARIHCRAALLADTRFEQQVSFESATITELFFVHHTRFCGPVSVQNARLPPRHRLGRCKTERFASRRLRRAGFHFDPRDQFNRWHAT